MKGQPTHDLRGTLGCCVETYCRLHELIPNGPGDSKGSCDDGGSTICVGEKIFCKIGGISGCGWASEKEQTI